MPCHAGSLAIVLVPWFVAGLGRAAVAQEEIDEYVGAGPANQGQQVPPEYGPPPPTAADSDPSPPPIPPNVEGPAVSVPGGGYCYYGPHPVDTRVSVGESWDDTPGAHMHAYPPLDLRLFELRDGCYYFVGDPQDFGYVGPTYSYYGAHPILDAYGGGWCFMIGPHRHLWRPWSPHFTLVGPWYYWEGPYDPFFWAYWPYYSYYYRSYYPQYYVGGRFYRDGYAVAPPIHRVPPSSHVVGSSSAGSPGWRGSQSVQPANGWRGSQAAPRSNAPVASPYRSVEPAATYRSVEPAIEYRSVAPAVPAAPAASYRPAA
ncbi:MAG: hypothetical protein WBP56_01030, partial [Polyangia bacterium]